jgi:hypothetical protein
MKRETELLFEHIASEDRDLIELVTANYTFVDGRLADFYGIEDVPEPGFHKVDLPPESRRGGILTQGSFLVATSNPNRTSPVKRGLFVLENLMAIEPPPPPPDIPALDDARANGERPRTVREQLELHRSDKSCASCHAHFDPIGLVLENYDAIGKWRSVNEAGGPIDASGVFPDGTRFEGLSGLKSILLSQHEQFVSTLTEKLLIYALGRGLEYYDMPQVRRIIWGAAGDDYRWSSIVLGIVSSTPFQMRRSDS